MLHLCWILIWFDQIGFNSTYILPCSFTEFKLLFEEILRLHRGPKPPCGGEYDPTRNIIIKITKKWTLLFDSTSRYYTSDHYKLRIENDTGDLFSPSGKVGHGNMHTAPHYGRDVLDCYGGTTTKQMRNSTNHVLDEMKRWKIYQLSHGVSPETLPPLYIQTAMKTIVSS